MHFHCVFSQRHPMMLAMACLALPQSLSGFFTHGINARRPLTSRHISSITTTEATAVEEQKSIDAVIKRIQNDHDTEVLTGFALFGKSSTTQTQSTDDDFISREVPVGTAGPDEFHLEHGNEIFQTKHPLLTDAECDALIAEARGAIASGLKQEASSGSSNSQLGEVRVSQLPHGKQWLEKALHEKFFPLLSSRFGIPAEELTLHDALIIGYGYFRDGARSQPVHRDSSILSLNVALSPISDYDANGGGTYFEPLPKLESVIKTERGHVLCHLGGIPHAGRGIAHGERWILVLFCVAKTYPQLARRCHAMGMMQNDEGLVEEAALSFRTGLSLSPRDHLLLTSLGGVHMSKGEGDTACQYLDAAARSYPYSVQSNLSLGKLFLGKRRARAALRRLDSVLEFLKDEDLSVECPWMPLRAAGWDARYFGAQAAILCAVYALSEGCESFSSLEELERAVGRLEVVLRAAPGDESVRKMMDKAKELLAEQR